MKTRWVIDEQDSLIHIHLYGNLEVGSSTHFREQLRAIVSKSVGKQVVIDMSEVAFMDSTGLAALVLGLKIVQQNNGAMVLAGVTPAIMNMFKMTLLDSAFTFAEVPYHHNDC